MNAKTTQSDLQPSIIVIFGITGDLSQRKLLPALYHLLKDESLHKDTQIIGVTRRDVTAKQLLEKTELCVLENDNVCDPKALKLMEQKLSMFKMDLTNGDDYDKLREHLDTVETKHGVCMNRLYYLSIPPQVYRPVVRQLGTHKLNQSCQHDKADARLLIEKPFGYDLTSAHELIDEMANHFKEKQIFRIDHYLAKETTQNILAFRFENSIFAAIWDNQHVTAIDIVASEDIGIEGRATFYDQVGALRDLIQSHLLQLLAITTMERPKHQTSEAIHASKLKLLQDVQHVPADKVFERSIRGQYDGYKKEAENDRSDTETFAALRLFIENSRWHDVPITIVTGKALQKKETKIMLHFKHPEQDKRPNVLTFAIQPHEGITITMCVKRPGYDNQLDQADLDFAYQRTFDEQGHPDAYERVLVDAVRGDRTLFATSDEVITAWQIIEPVITAWSHNNHDLVTYKKHSTGPDITKLG